MICDFQSVMMDWVTPEQAQWEIQGVCNEMLDLLKRKCPNVFWDIEPHGNARAHSPI